MRRSSPSPRDSFADSDSESVGPAGAGSGAGAGAGAGAGSDAVEEPAQALSVEHLPGYRALTSSRIAGLSARTCKALDEVMAANLNLLMKHLTRSIAASARDSVQEDLRKEPAIAARAKRDGVPLELLTPAVMTQFLVDFRMLSHVGWVGTGASDAKTFVGATGGKLFAASVLGCATHVRCPRACLDRGGCRCRSRGLQLDDRGRRGLVRNDQGQQEESYFEQILGGGVRTCVFVCVCSMC